MASINTNIAATVAANALTKNERAMGTAMERLSTGVRINSAKDDAAGLAVSSRMSAQISGLNQAVRNANDAISLVQVAEGALVEVTNMLQRMRELAVQSASDTNSSSDRTALNTEFTQLRAEVNRVAQNTQWNGFNILDKSFASGSGEFKFQVGSNAAQTIDLTIGDYQTTDGDQTTTATLDTTTDGGGPGNTDKQVTTIELDGTPAEGDVISVSVGDKSFAYTVTADDDEASIATAIFDGLGGTSGITDIEAVDDGAGTLTFTADGDANTFDISVGKGGLLSGINGSSITSQSNADTAIAALDTAIATVNSGRATMGATMNRLQYAADNLANVSANTSASRGRILDADYAAETTELARTQIIAQAGTAMLAQANQVKQSVLALLQ
jgi:flagellin